MDSTNIDMNALSTDLLSMWQVLMSDVIHSQDVLANLKSDEFEDFWIRTYTRAVFAAIEGACSMFKHQAYIAETNKAFLEGTITLGRLSVLAGESYVINDVGEIRAQPFRTTFLKDILFSLLSYQEAQGVKHRTAKGDQWHRIRHALEVRHRITHPKNKDGLKITPEELADIRFTLGWFLGELISVLKEKGYDGSVPEPPR